MTLDDDPINLPTLHNGGIDPPAHVPNDMEWIRIEEEKPPIGMYMIVTDGCRVGECIAAPKDDFVICNQYGDIVPWKKITHWMPLPEPPKE